jgi:hypothetical protein
LRQKLMGLAIAFLLGTHDAQHVKSADMVRKALQDLAIVAAGTGKVALAMGGKARLEQLFWRHGLALTRCGIGRKAGP